MEHPPHDPVITVVIPTFNRADTVLRAVRSVLDQRGPAAAVIVVDDGSTDNTQDVLAAFDDPRLQVVAAVHEGVCAARNRGAALATTPWLGFLDSDDEIVDGWLQAMTDELAAGAPLVSCTADLRYPDGRIEQAPPKPLGPAFGSVTGQYLAGAFALTAELFHAVGGYRDGLGYGENTELWMRLGTEVAARGQTASVVNSALVRVAAVDRKYDARRYFDAGVHVLRESGHLLQRDPQLHATYLAITGVAATRCGHRAEGRRLLARAWRIDRRNVRHLARWVRAWLPARRTA
jgi:glycosyltransferase involved in cell wall biosynthesis